MTVRHVSEARCVSRTLCRALVIGLVASACLFNVNASAMGLPKLSEGPYQPAGFSGEKTVALAAFPAARFFKQAETQGAGVFRSEVTLGEMTGEIDGDGARWVLEIGAMPGFDVRRLGRPLSIEMTVGAPGTVKDVAVEGEIESQALEDAFHNVFAAYVPVKAIYSVGEPYYKDRAVLRAGGLRIAMTVESVVDGVVNLNGRPALAVRFAGQGRVSEVGGWLSLDVAGFHYIDLATSVILRSAELTVTQGVSNGASFSVQQFIESVTELPPASRI